MPGRFRNGLASVVIGAVCSAAMGGAVRAQDDYERSSHGRIRDRSASMDAGQALLAAGVECRVVRARLVGRDENRTPLYEAACADGDVYTVIGSPTNRAFNCLDLEAQAAARRANRRVPLVRQCTIRPTRSLAQQGAAYAREAGLGCRVDQARSLGRTAAGSRLFEVGCRGEVGAWLEQTSAGWTATDCYRVQRSGGACTFTDEREKAMTAQRWLSASPQPAACRVTGASFLGESRSGGLYEARCAGGAGFVVRRSASGAVDAVFPCGTDFGVEVDCQSAVRRDGG